jgi:PAS domain S-box-containing protein
MTGYRAEEIRGQSFSRFFTDEDARAGKPATELARAREDGHFGGEGWRVRKDGSRFWASVAATALRNESGALVGFAEITRDMTLQQQAAENERTLLREQVARAAAQENAARLRASEEAAREAAVRYETAARRAEEANRVKDEFLATVSHELRTPLNAILGWAKMLGGRVSDPTATKGLDVIRRNAEAQARLIEDILDVSRIITGKMRVDVKPANLLALVQEAIDVVRPSAVAKRITIDLRAPHEVMAAGDPERLRQVIWNLLSNAVKFTDPDGLVAVGLSSEGSDAQITVDDTGRGIEPEFLPYVFDRFQQADSSTTRKHGGLGLGLAIVRHIVELHGGRVRAESGGRGTGARFTITLPISAVIPAARPEDEVAAGPASPPVPIGPSLDGLRVLVVDDDVDAREMLRDVLASSGAAVEIAESAVAGLEAVRRFRPDILVSDIGMPGEDGYSFMRRLRELRADDGGHIPSIALTAYARPQDRTKALAAGFTTHLGKPADPMDLVAAIANIAALTRN